MIILELLKSSITGIYFITQYIHVYKHLYIIYFFCYFYFFYFRMSELNISSHFKLSLVESIVKTSNLANCVDEKEIDNVKLIPSEDLTKLDIIQSCIVNNINDEFINTNQVDRASYVDNKTSTLTVENKSDVNQVKNNSAPKLKRTNEKMVMKGMAFLLQQVLLTYFIN